MNSLFLSVSTLALNAERLWDFVVLGKQLTATQPSGIRNAIGSRTAPGPAWLVNLRGNEEPAIVRADQYGNFFPIDIWQINMRLGKAGIVCTSYKANVL